MVRFENIPEELKQLKQWVCWTDDKMPKNPKTGGNAMSNNPTTWGTFEQAYKAIDKYDFDGVGFMFANGYFGVDLDKCLDDKKFIHDFIDTLNSYTEVSKSKNGIHIICKGDLPVGARRKDNVEMYNTGRYFIMTGNVYGDNPRPIKNCTEAIKTLHEKYLGQPKVKKLELVKPRIEKMDISDEQIIALARGAKNGSFFEQLYAGHWEGGGYPSQSEADLAFANMLAFWCQCDIHQMDRIFRNSGLYRPKWDQLRGTATYGQLTLENAISKCDAMYEPEHVGMEHNLVAGVFGKKRKPVIRKYYDMTDTGNGERFADKFRGQVRWSYQNKTWYYWDGSVWHEDLTGETKKLTHVILDDIKKEGFEQPDEELSEKFFKWASKSASSRAKSNMLVEAQHLEGIPVLSSEFDPDNDLFNTRSGIVNLRNGELIPHESHYMMSRISNAKYKEDLEEPKLWLKFLDDVTGGDKDLQRFLQKAVGYSLTGSTKEQCVFFLWGTGNNGKSTFLDTITDALGTYGTNVQPETIMTKSSFQSGGANTDIARLKGSRFVTTVEPNESVRLNEGLLKQLTGGDKVTARFLYGKEFEFEPEFKIWMATNHKPIIRGTDVGIWRRIRLVPFTVHIPPEKVDKNLKHKLKKELPQILKWIVEGCLMWQIEGLNPPKCIEDATEEYKQDMDVLGNFCSNCVEVNYLSKEKASDVFEVYSEWADENNEYKMSSSRFSKEFAKKFPEKVRRSDGIYYKNCKFTSYGESFKDKKLDFSSSLFKGYHK